jgi:hypothetical protein
MNKTLIIVVGIFLASCSTTVDIAKLLEPHDNLKITYLMDPYGQDEIQSSNYFIDALFFSEGDTLFGKSIIWNMNSNEIDLSDANIKLTGQFEPGDSLFYTDGSFDYMITGFEKETVELPFGRVKNCIRLDQSTVYLEEWADSDEPSFETVWVHKKYGVVKWIRRTGRIEEMSDVVRK